MTISQAERTKKYSKTEKGRLAFARAARKWRAKNPEKSKANTKLYRDSHKEQIKAYGQRNPEKQLRNMEKYLKKQGIIFNLDQHEYKWALMSWSKAVKKRDNNTCQNCASKENLHAHHILERKHYTKISLNINNGITLCMNCHHEVHI